MSYGLVWGLRGTSRGTPRGSQEVKGYVSEVPWGQHRHLIGTSDDLQANTGDLGRPRGPRGMFRGTRESRGTAGGPRGSFWLNVWASMGLAVWSSNEPISSIFSPTSLSSLLYFPQKENILSWSTFVLRHVNERVWGSSVFFAQLDNKERLKSNVLEWYMRSVWT